MAAIFKEAQEKVQEFNGVYHDSYEIEEFLKSLGLKQGEFAINVFRRGIFGSPDLLGMHIDSDKALNIAGDETKVRNFAKKRGLTARFPCINAVLCDSENKTVGKIFSYYFAASTPELFEGMGKYLIELETLPINVPVKTERTMPQKRTMYQRATGFLKKVKQ